MKNLKDIIIRELNEMEIDNEIGEKEVSKYLKRYDGLKCSSCNKGKLKYKNYSLCCSKCGECYNN